MIHIQQSPLTDQLWQECQPLIQANAQAAGDYPLRADKWAIQALNLSIWTMRDKGKLVGYCAHVVAEHPIYAQRWASCCAIYVMPAWRGCARRMIKQIEKDLIAMDVRHVTYSCPSLSSFAPFLENRRMGYQCMEIVMEKEL